MKKHKGGPPQKAPGGLSRALYLRIGEDMDKEIVRVLEKANKGRDVPLAKADVIRAALREGLRLWR